MEIKMTKTPSSIDALFAKYVDRVDNCEPGSESDWRRDHLGASIAGHKCDRYLWLTFRWALRPGHDGRHLRLFGRGQREESWIIEDLRAAGFNVSDRAEDGNQHRVKFSTHFGGGIDGLINGLVEAPKTEHVLEIKTHRNKSFERLVKDGVKRSKPQHWAQMQLYMLGRKLDRAFYVAVNKDNDEIHSERVNFDRVEAEKLRDRALAIIAMDCPPAKQEHKDSPPCLYTSKDGETWPCQFLELCHGSATPNKNCRTCISSTPADEGWKCSFEKSPKCGDMSSVDQRIGCDHYFPHPLVANWHISKINNQNRSMEVVTRDGRKLTFGGVKP